MVTKKVLKKTQFLFSLEIRGCLVMFACLHAESHLSSIQTQNQRWLTWWKAPLHLSTSLTPSSQGSNEMQIIASDIRVCRTCCNPTTERSISTAADSQTRQAGTDSGRRQRGCDSGTKSWCLRQSRHSARWTTAYFEIKSAARQQDKILRKGDTDRQWDRPE